MKIVMPSIVLRDMVISDIEDDIRWKTVEKSWQDWDEPWEYEDEDEMFNEDAYRQAALQEFQQLEKMREANQFRLSLEIDTIDGVHIGTIDAYRLSNEVKQALETLEIYKHEVSYAIGIAIYDSAYWNQGLGSQALEAYVKYHISHQHYSLYLETWSGNTRMVTVAKKLGFQEVYRRKNYFKAFGKQWDAIVFEYQKKVVE